MKAYFLLFAALFYLNTNNAQMVLNLYDEDGKPNSPIPNAKPCAKEETYVETAGVGRVGNVTHPTLSVFIPKVRNAVGTSVIICPGGGYTILAIDHEGFDVARAFNEMGITAFVLKYRIPDEGCMVNKETVPLMDAQQAIKLVRKNAAKYQIDPSKIGIMGFSAGGHLASTAGTHFNQPVIANPEQISLRPDFMVLLYPVISFKETIGHQGSKNNLLGKNASPELIHHFSNEEQVTSQTPPTFLVHAVDDKSVPVSNSVSFLSALVKNKVAAEMHLYQGGGHGFGLNNKTTKEQWLLTLKNWMLTNKFLN